MNDQKASLIGWPFYVKTDSQASKHMTDHIPCYYINLERSPDRRVFMEQQFEKAGLTARRIVGIDAKEMDIAEREALLKMQDPQKSLSAPEVGCWLSHKKAWHLIATGKDPYGAVFEDDVKFSSFLPMFVRKIDWIPSDCQCVKIDTSHATASHRKIQDLVFTPYYLSKPFGRLSSAGGYVISKQGAKTLLEKSELVKKPVDIFLFGNTDPELSFLQLHPATCIQVSLYEGNEDIPSEVKRSTIDYARRTQQTYKLFGAKKVRRELLRPLRQLSRKLKPIVIAISKRAYRYQVEFKE